MVMGMGAAPAFAAPEEEAVDPDVIVVTATRRQASIQDVPLSISVVTTENLQRQAATSFVDYATAIPNLAFGAAGEGTTNSRTIAIRGIGDRGTTGFYIDETPVPESLDPRIVDVARIEVLRGPQGTLYGARSMGGTVRLITTQPTTDEFSARLHAGMATTRGTDRPSYQVDGALNIPIVADKVGLRLVGLHQYEAGFITRLIVPASGPATRIRNVARTETNGGSAALTIKPADGLTLTPRFLYQETRTNGYPFTDLTIGTQSPIVLKPTSLVQRRGFDVPEASRDKWLLASFDARLEKSFGTFTSASAFFSRRSRDIDDQTDFIAAAFGISPIPTSIEVRNKRDSFTQELRFSSAFSGPFQIVTGLYFSHGKFNYYYPPNIVPGLDAAFGGAFGTDLVYVSTAPGKQTEKAAYAEASLEIIDGLTATAGLRGFHVKTRSSRRADGIANGGLLVIPQTSSSESGVTPKLSLQYKPSRDLQLFATAAKGFRPGGVNAQIPAALGCQAELAALGQTNDSVGSFKSDSVWSYEAGVKASPLGRALTVNATAFRIDWTDIQQLVRLQCGFGFRGNAGKARSQGFEIEASIRPLAGLSIDFGLGYTDAKFTETVLATRRADGDPVPGIPKYTANVSVDYSFPVTDAVQGFVYGDYRYVDESLSSNNAATDPVTGLLVPRIRPSYEIVNLRGGARFGAYEVALFAKNLTDTRASLSDNVAAAAETPDRARVYINTPRTFGVEARVAF